MTTFTLDTSRRDRFLNLIEPRMRGPVMNYFLSGPRAGITDPEAVVDHAMSALASDFERREHNQNGRKLETILQTLLDNPETALDCARYAVDYNALPAPVVQELKETRNREAVAEWMKNNPPTPKQIAFLRTLGHVGHVENRLHASELIERLQASERGAKR